MSDNSLIEWCTATWNFLIGCTKKSAGCQHCYAIRQAWRMMHNPNPKIAKKFEGTVHKDSKGELNWTGRVNFDDEVILKPLSWRLPRRVFVNSLSDLFHKNVRDEWIDMAFAVMAMCPQHTFQILTKEPERARDYFSDLDDLRLRIGAAAGTFLDGDWIWNEGKQFRERIEKLISATHGVDFDEDENEIQVDETELPLPNVWLGVSVEDQKTADERIPLLLQTPAAVRWISAEPLLGPIDLQAPWSALNDEYPAHGIHWLVAGGESGPKARPMHPDWARSLRDQCVSAGVPFFFKQWGEHKPLASVFKRDDEMFPYAAALADERKSIAMDGSGATYWNDGDEPPVPPSARDAYVMSRVGKKAAGRLLDGREWNEFPEAKAVTV